ncbi:hypothetical protein QFZ96_002685 [Paraburkholderia youngii]
MGAEYNLSQRTKAYAPVGYVANKGTMNQTIIYGQPEFCNLWLRCLRGLRKSIRNRCSAMKTAPVDPQNVGSCCEL